MINLARKLRTIWRNNSLLIMIVVLFVLGIVTISLQSSALRKANNEKQTLQNNIAALSDSVRITYNKWKEAEYNKQSFVVSDPEDLKTLANDLYKELEKIKGEVKSISKTVAQVKNRDTVPLYVSVPSPNHYAFNFDTTFSPGNRQAFGGFINTEDPIKSRVTNRELDMTLFMGIKKVDGKPTMFARTDFPDVNFDFQSAEIDPNYFNKKEKQPRLSLGAHIGYAPLAYDITERKFAVRNQIAGSIGLNIRIK